MVKYVIILKYIECNKYAKSLKYYAKILFQNEKRKFIRYNVTPMTRNYISLYKLYKYIYTITFYKYLYFTQMTKKLVEIYIEFAYLPIFHIYFFIKKILRLPILNY